MHEIEQQRVHLLADAGRPLQQLHELGALGGAHRHRVRVAAGDLPVRAQPQVAVVGVVPVLGLGVVPGPAPRERREERHAEAPAVHGAEALREAALRGSAVAAQRHDVGGPRLAEALLGQVGRGALRPPRAPNVLAAAAAGHAARRGVAGAGRGLELDGAAEVREHRRAVVLEQDVLRLHVEVVPVARVAVRQARGDVRREAADALLGEAAARRAAHALEQVLRAELARDHGRVRVRVDAVGALHAVEVKGLERGALGERARQTGRLLRGQRPRAQHVGVARLGAALLQLREALPVRRLEHLERELAAHDGAVARERLHDVDFGLEAAADAPLHVEAPVRRGAAHVQRRHLGDHDAEAATGLRGSGALASGAGGQGHGHDYPFL
mmetsp:Transcript_28963/g.92602  ORF Transcript_28963/g.92602 Transcript_28963/m.92602 type:complete len:384 (-) Transcript_28963:1144-2295(-)